MDLTIAQVAEICSLSTSAIDRSIKRGELPGHKLCGKIRVEPEAFKQWKEAHRIAPKAPASPMVDPQGANGSTGGLFRERLEQIERREHGA